MAKPKSKETYADAKFAGVDLTSAKLAEAEFDGCTFESCTFNEAVLSHCRFTKCRFLKSDLSLFRPENCRFTDVEFVDCKLVGVDWTASGTTNADRMLFSASFERCVLDYAVLKGLPLKKMTKCTARETDFTEAILRDADCRETDFAGATFMRSDLRGANFVGARNYTIDVIQNKVRKARFSWPEVESLVTLFGVIVEG
ncbi:MAG: pentapeptide repeat-containing protein [Chloroflexota bacterium]